MAYNLDFSAWQDMRRAQANSEIAKGNYSAQKAREKYDLIKKGISSGLSVVDALMSANRAAASTDKMFNMASKTGLLMNDQADAMQALSSANLLTDDEAENERLAQAYKQLMIKKYGLF